MASKKSFKAALEQQGQSAVMSYLSTGSEPPEDQLKECKSKRLNLLIKPSTHALITKIAYMKRISMNELINSLLEKYAADNADQVQKYIDTYGEDE